MEERKLARWLSRYDGPPLTLMEVCGTHTSALYHSGIRQMLSPQITFLSGPGCPVCVTPTSYIDKLARYALTPGCQVMAFGDLLAVPGSRMSLSGARDRGGRVDFFYDVTDLRRKPHRWLPLPRSCRRDHRMPSVQKTGGRNGRDDGDRRLLAR